MPAPTLPFKPRHLVTLLACALSPLAASAATPFTGLSQAWTFSHTGGQFSEIASFDAQTNTLWVAGIVGVDVLNARTGSLIQHIDTTAWGSINSVAINNGIAAFAIESSVRTDPGVVKLFDTSTLALASGTNSFTVGALPDMLTFTPNGSKLLVANEASPTSYTGFDPAGSVSIIDMNSRTLVATAGFSGVPITGSVRTTPMDFEPEYIAVNATGTKAYVTLQEANAMGVLDLNSNTFTSVVGLGTKSFNTTANAIDTNDKKDVGSLKTVNVSGLYQPDSIAAYQANGQTYLVMANEGDTREDDGDKARASTLGATGDLARLNISTTDSTAGNLVTFGGRSFSIRDAAGNIVFDSGNKLDAEAIARGIYDDGRSDDKGVEPEGVTLKVIDGRTYAFIGLERTTKGAVAVYDITDPANSVFIDMIVTNGDVAPEGLTSFTMDGKHYLAIANEVSNTTTLYALAPVPEASSWMMLLGGLGLLGFMRRRAA
ncbi:hypothetical protein GCM10027046_36450 [Uliginosibacterium flavum]|uniref:Choice-of-anchor I family protein n=1 Tax=Uliginosibacterium flavum TaxID=1396831 RepID=A0ABV2TNE5_9RHOO